MFGKNGPTLLELARQALSSTQCGYDLLAPKFDVTPFRTPDEILRPALEAIGPVDAALDLCCGTGAAMELLLPKVRKRLVGVDFSHGMLQQGRRNLSAYAGRVSPEWVQADVRALSFRQEFDLVTCFGALGHIVPEEQRAFLRMIHAALRPGGQFLFVTGYPPALLSPASLALRGFNAVMRIRNTLRRPPFIMYYLMFLLPEIEQTLTEEGFEVEVRSGLFARPFDRYRLVVATRR